MAPTILARLRAGVFTVALVTRRLKR